MEIAGKTLKIIWHSIEFPAYFWTCVLEKKETATILALLSRGKKYLHRGLLLMNENYLRKKFTVYKCLARSRARGEFFSKYSKTSF